MGRSIEKRLTEPKSIYDVRLYENVKNVFKDSVDEYQKAKNVKKSIYQKCDFLKTNLTIEQMRTLLSKLGIKTDTEKLTGEIEGDETVEDLCELLQRERPKFLNDEEFNFMEILSNKVLAHPSMGKHYIFSLILFLFLDIGMGFGWLLGSFIGKTMRFTHEGKERKNSALKFLRYVKQDNDTQTKILELEDKMKNIKKKSLRKKSYRKKSLRKESQ